MIFVFAFVALILSIIFLYSNQKSAILRKYVKRGMLVGLILAVGNVLTVGVLSWGILSFPLNIIRIYGCIVGDCNPSGDSGLGFILFDGTLLVYIIPPLLFGFIAYLRDSVTYPSVTKKVIFTIVLILVLILLNFWSLIAFNAQNLTMGYHESNIPSYYQQIIFTEKFNKTIEDCEGQPFGKNTLRAQCVAYFAYADNDRDICFDAYDNLYNENRSDYTLEDINKSKGYCLHYYAVFTGDENLCANIDDMGYPYGIASPTTNSEVYCKYQVSVLHNDKNLCESLRSDSRDNEHYYYNSCSETMNEPWYDLTRWYIEQIGPRL